MTVSGAYGRDYKSAKDMKADWDGGKDFVIRDVSHMYGGKYVSRQDVLHFGLSDDVMGRYKRDTQVCVLQKGK